MSVWTISFLLVTLIEGMIITAFERCASSIVPTWFADSREVMSLPSMPLVSQKTHSLILLTGNPMTSTLRLTATVRSPHTSPCSYSPLSSTL